MTTQFDKAELKRIISKIKTLPRPVPKQLVQRPPISKHRLAAAKMLIATLAKAGLDVAKFNKLMAQDQREAREFLKKRLVKPSAAARAAAKAAHRQRVEAYAKAGKLVTPDFPPPQVIQIDQPFYISGPTNVGWNYTGNIAPNDSFIKFVIDTDNNTPTNSGLFTFWYIWSNDSDLIFYMSAETNVITNGSWSLEANPGELWGLFGSDTAYLELGAQFETWRYSGWGTDPVTGQSNDWTAYPLPTGGDSVLSEYLPQNGVYWATGVFDDILSQPGQGPIVVPPGAVALFKVYFLVESGFGEGGGGDIADLINLDLNSGSNGVFCPSVWLEIWFKIPPFE